MNLLRATAAFLLVLVGAPLLLIGSKLLQLANWIDGPPDIMVLAGRKRR